MTTPAQAMVGELRALLEKATPRPWEFDFGVIPPDGPGRYAEIYWVDEDREPITIAEYNEFREWRPEWGRANPKLITAAVNNLEPLLDLIESLSARAGVEGDWRSGLFEILRRHDVGEQCFAEVAALTFVRPSKPGGADREELRRCLRGFVSQQDEMHGGRWYVVGPDLNRVSKRTPHLYDSEDEAIRALDDLQINAILASLKGEGESDWFAGDVDADGNDLVTLTGDDLRQMIASAFSSGCYAVHFNYQEDRDPDFTEAGIDYADGVHPRAAP